MDQFVDDTLIREVSAGGRSLESKLSQSSPEQVTRGGHRRRAIVSRTCIVVDVKAPSPHLRSSLGRELKVFKGFKLSPIHTTVQVLVGRLHQGSQDHPVVCSEVKRSQQ